MADIVIMKEIHGRNEEYAESNRRKLSEDHVLMVNIMGAPGAGKTTFLKALCGELKKRGIISGVIEGDLYSTIDTDSFINEGYRSLQINTEGECHIDANVVRQGYDRLGITDGVVFIENVGNLICPAEFDLGEGLRIITASTPEGDDKPYKYVPMYSYVDAVVLTKCDLKEAVGFDTEYFTKGLRALNDAPVYETYVKGDNVSGIGEVADLIEKKYKEI
ncbi:MAG: hydrogenase nickel incorporation protein HypB [Lachnospiraceae bacterium]|nr:hydrogenase nickel incorporation protein HypB [Lachnospiraceae bacterium]MBR1913325.1 hydrogenase nickel incorporation protein HypB [Lachnospiraceae bacterium]